MIEKFFLKRTVRVAAFSVVLMGLIFSTPRASLLAADNNLIPNPKLQGQTGGKPSGWNTDTWKNNRAVFRFVSGGKSGGNYLSVQILQHKSGDSKWYFDDAAIKGGRTYKFSDSYRSNRVSYITARYKMPNGTYLYRGIKTLPPSPNGWTGASVLIPTPAGATHVTVFHLIQKKGTLQTKDFSLTLQNGGTSSGSNGKGGSNGNSGNNGATTTPTTTPPTPPAPTTTPTTTPPSDNSRAELISRGGIVSIVFDDNRLSAYQYALPIIDAAGFKSTHFIISRVFGPRYSSYMTQSQVKDVFDRGHEIGAHSRNHPHLTQLSTDDARTEIKGSLEDLLDMGISPVTVFTYPYGEYNDSIVNLVKEAGFEGARITQPEINTKSTDPYKIKGQSLRSSNTFEDIKAKIDLAVQQKGWYVFTIHQVNVGDEYSVSSELIQQIVNYLKNNNIPVVTMGEGVTHFLNK